MKFTAESFNKALNASAAQDRWNAWESYRDKLMDFIIKGMWGNGSCIILGAGNLHDIDLSALLAKTKELALADIDTESVKRGISLQACREDIDVIKMDIGALDSTNLFNRIEQDPADLGGILDSHKLATRFETTNYDNVMLSAVYTQLFIPQFLSMLTQANQDSQDSIEAALAFAARLISHLNDTVIELAADDATICAWSDIYEYGTSDPALRDIVAHIDDKEWIDAFSEAYIRDYGHGLGSYGIEDLARRLGDVSGKWLLWPFDNQRAMVVRVISGIVIK